ncbi:MAG: hypothetical protein KDC92_17570 [Bacteroidetes bacterium]|nr:hypothetical protein [Bacteroidota bacterium]
MFFKGKKHDIPSIFHDTVNEKPIEHCQICGKNVLLNQTHYVIEKAFKRKEVIFEYAICMDCAETKRGDMSKESMENISNYMVQHAQFQERFFELRDYDYDTNLWLGKCIFTNEPIDEQEEYQIQGVFVGDKMVSNQFPYMIGTKAMEAMQELLSSETKDEMNRFKDEFFNVPPELEELFKDPKYILVH